MKEIKKVRMVIAPHPDDDLIGCGGSIAKYLSQGNKIVIVFVTNGDAKNEKYGRAEFTSLRTEETKKAIQVIGGGGDTELIFLSERVWGINQERLRNNLLLNIRKFKPDICYIPHKDETHPDHKIVNQAALEAISAAPGPWFKNPPNEQPPQQDSWEIPVVLSYEISNPLPGFSYAEDVTGFIEKKIAALQEHKSQLAERRYDEAIKCFNRYRGIMTGQGDFCECFQVLKIKTFNI